MGLAYVLMRSEVLMGYFRGEEYVDLKHRADIDKFTKNVIIYTLMIINV